MKIYERSSINDSKITGIVVIKNKDGKIILKKENMIVETGREFIRDKFAKNAGIGNFSEGYSGTYLDYSLTHIGFGNSDVVTQYTMTELISEDTELRTPLSSVNVNKGTVEPYLKFTANVDRINEATGYTLREIGLYLTSGLIFTLFSRIVFDPIPIAAGEKYEVEYYIYF
jgi:hypothetical protein